MTTTTRGALAGLIGLAALGACVTTGIHDRAEASTCRTDAAVAFVGKAAPNDAIILRRTGSAIVRRIAPGDMMTRDYRVERVTVTIADGRVIAASCG